MLTNDMLYRCYSINLMEYLRDNNIQYILHAKDIKTNKEMWVYEKTPIFQQVFGVWINNSPKN